VLAAVLSGAFASTAAAPRRQFRFWQAVRAAPRRQFHLRQPACVAPTESTTDPLTIKAVVFDVGETLLDETRAWSAWADWLGIPRLTFMAALGAVLARDGEYGGVFDLFRPGLDLDAEVRRRIDAGENVELTEADLYPDVRPAMAALLDAGYRLGVVGNQPVTIEALFQALDVPFELVASSDGWGLAKPDPRFFERVASSFGLPPEEVAYVGDRVDNDVRPAAAAGLCSVFIRRGPWGWIIAGRDDPPEATISIDSLKELPVKLESLTRSSV
jgi:HAD superfamily hydrolase (TIGR01549 family)